MKLEHSLKIDVSEDVLRQRIMAYLTKSGYRLVNSQPSLTFQRGSMFGSLMSFSPKSWQSSVVISFSSLADRNIQAVIVFDINTTGQWVTDQERQFWQAELNNLVNTISTGSIQGDLPTESAKSALSQNLIASGLIVALGVGMALGGLFIFGTRNAALFAGLLGIGLGVFIAQRWLNFRIGG